MTSPQTEALAEDHGTGGRRLYGRVPPAPSLLPYVVMAVLLIVLAVAGPSFYSVANSQNLVRQSAILIVVSVGVTLVVVSGSIDLSVGAVATVSGTVGALAALHLGSVWVLVAIPVGLLCGLVNGFLTAVAKLPSFIVTLGTLYVFDGLALKVSNGSTVALNSPRLDEAVNGEVPILGFPAAGLWALSVVIVVAVLAYWTTFGRYVYAIGGNERVASLSGIPVVRVKVLVFGLSGALAGIAGLMLIARQGGSFAGMGESYLLDSLAAVVMGGTALSGGQGGPFRSLVGALVIVVLTNGMTILQIDPHLQGVVRGVIVILAVAVTLRRRSGEVVK